MTTPIELELNVNGGMHHVAVEPRKLLSDVIREDLHLRARGLWSMHRTR
jgi:aerobic carbon-monoxide dehydrogenase small subunit